MCNSNGKIQDTPGPTEQACTMDSRSIQKDPHCVTRDGERNTFNGLVHYCPRSLECHDDQRPSVTDTIRAKLQEVWKDAIQLESRYGGGDPEDRWPNQI